MKIYKSVSELVGRTPLLEINRQAGNSCRLLAKLECFNPAGSAKDRVARQMIESAEKRGLIQPGGTIIEPTSGNTGIGLAAMAVPRGYRVILTMPDTMSVERRNLLKAYGAEVVLTPGAQGMAGAIAKAQELADMIDRILPEYTEIWNYRNYEMGIERFVGYLRARRDEMRALKAE
jgi:cysteine synthase A